MSRRTRIAKARPHLPEPRGRVTRCRDFSGYITPAGKLPSVTTIVGATKSEEAKAALEAWKTREGNEHVAFVAPRRGTWMHRQAERWIEGKATRDAIAEARGSRRKADLPAPTSRPTCTPLGDLPGAAQRAAFGAYWRSLEPWLEANFHSALAMEKPIWHPAGFSGTFDCLGWLYESEEITLLDWKSRGGRALDPDGEQIRGYLIQLAAYRAGINWTYGLTVNQAHLVVAMPGGEPQVVHLDADLLAACEDEFFHRLRIFQEVYGHVLA